MACRVELEAWLEQKIEVQGAGQYGGDGVGIGLAKLMAKAGMRKKHEIHFRDMIKVFFTGGMVKAPYITDTDIEAMCEYAYPKAPPPPPLSGDEEAMMRILWNIWRPDPDQAYITLDDLIRSQPDVSA